MAWGFGTSYTAVPWGMRNLGGSSMNNKPETPKNPWQKAHWSNYNQAGQTPYGAEWKSAVAQAMKFGQKDWTGDLRRFAGEDVDREQQRQLNRMGSMGMRELSLQGDVQDDWAKRRTDADTRAAMQGQQMQQSAMETMRGMLGSASGVELDKLSKMIMAAQAGGGNYNDFMSMLIPLMEKLGYYGGGKKPDML